MNPSSFFIFHGMIHPEFVEESLNILLRDAIHPGIAEHREDMLPEVTADGPPLAF